MQGTVPAAKAPDNKNARIGHFHSGLTPHRF